MPDKYNCPMNTHLPTRRIFRHSPSALVLLPCIFALAFSSCTHGATGSIDPEGVVRSERDGAIVLEPATAIPRDSLGFIFIPGGLVEAEAYVDILAPVARAGYTVLIPRVPFGLAITDTDIAWRLATSPARADRSWAVGGHSLGGAVAAMSVHNHRETFPGLILLAAYPPESHSITDWKRPVLSISASADGLATPAKVAAARPFLPPDMREELIPGGNHAGFGSYGPQDGDGQATMPAQEQHRLVAEWILAFLDGIASGDSPAD